MVTPGTWIARPMPDGVHWSVVVVGSLAPVALELSQADARFIANAHMVLVEIRAAMTRAGLCHPTLEVRALLSR